LVSTVSIGNSPVCVFGVWSTRRPNSFLLSLGPCAKSLDARPLESRLSQPTPSNLSRATPFLGSSILVNVGPSAPTGFYPAAASRGRHVASTTFPSSLLFLFFFSVLIFTALFSPFFDPRFQFAVILPFESLLASFVFFALPFNESPSLLFPRGQQSVLHNPFRQRMIPRSLPELGYRPGFPLVSFVVETLVRNESWAFT